MPMNLEMQIAVIKRHLEKYNPGVDIDEIDYMDGWEDNVDSELTFPENIDELERIYPDFNWSAPEKRPRPGKPILWKKEDFCAGPYSDHYEMNAKVTVKPHPTKAKGKIYTRGRIQLTVDERYIGRTAEVHILIRAH